MQHQPWYRRRSRYVFLAILLAAAVLSAGAFLSGCGRNADRGTVATVNGEPITKEQLYQEMYAQVGHETLEGLITQTLILQEGRANDIEVSKAEIEARLEEVIETGFSSREEFLNALKSYGLQLEDIQRQIRIQLTAEKLLADRVQVDEEEAQAYFETNRDRFGRAESIKARHIVLETREEGEEVRAALAAGADFAKLAEEKSKDSLTAGAGGELGLIERGGFLLPWQEALFDLDEGALSPVLEGPNGFHVVEVLEKHPAEEPSYDEVKDKVHRLLRDQQLQQLYPGWVDSLRAKAKIEYLLEKDAKSK